MFTISNITSVSLRKAAESVYQLLGGLAETGVPVKLDPRQLEGAANPKFSSQLCSPLSQTFWVGMLYTQGLSFLLCNNSHKSDFSDWRVG